MDSNKFIVFVVVLLSQLIGCALPFIETSPVTMDCATVLQSPLRDMNYGEQSITETKQFLTNAFPETADTISHQEYRMLEGEVANYDIIKWENNNSLSSAVLVEGTLIYTEIEIGRIHFTGGQAIECFGTPEYYLAYIGPNELFIFEIWYPSQGVVLHSLFADQNKVTLGNEIEVQKIVYFKPTDDPLHVKNNMYYVTHPVVDRREKELLKIWPSLWSDIVVEPLFR